MAVLSAMLHPRMEIASVMLKEFRRSLDSESSSQYCEAVLRALPRRERRALEAEMLKDFLFKTFYARTCIAKGVEEGLVLGRQEGRQEGRAKGRIKGRKEGQERGKLLALRDTALKMAKVKLAKLTAAERAALKAVEDDRKLTELILALGQAEGRAQARAALTQSLAAI